MTQNPLQTTLTYYGISPWEIEVIYGLLRERFEIKQEETEQTDPKFVSLLDIPIPLSFNEEFFKWFEYKRWENVKRIFKEMKRRRGKGNALQISLSFVGNPEIKFIIDPKDGQWFNNAVEKIDFVLELLPYHLNPENLPQETRAVVYKFDTEAIRWRLKTAITNNKKFNFEQNGWKIIT